MEQRNGSFWVDAWHVQPSLNKIEGAEEAVQVEPRIMDVLVCLAARPGEVVTREELMETVWPDTYVGDDPLNRAISELRKAFGDDARQPRFIETIRKSGYRLIAPVADEPPAANGAARPARRRRFRGGAIVLAVVLFGLAGLGWWLIDAGGRATAPSLRPQRFTSFPGREYDPSFSTSGDQVAFSWDGAEEANQDVYVRLLDSETPLRLTTDPGRDANPAWSPDDQFIAFSRISDAGCGLYLIPALGGAERRLAACHVDHDVNLSWSPRGAALAFADRPALQAPSRIYVLSTESLEASPLTDPPAQYRGDDYPAFSPDGRRLAFVRTSISGVENIFVVPAEGGPPRQLTDENQRIAGLAWAGDDHLVYASDRDGTFSLWRLSTQSGTLEWLLTGGDSVVKPTFDRSHGRLVYAQQVLDKNIWRIPLGDAEGRAAPLLASTRWDLSPQYAPTGERIAFMSNRSGSYEIWVADADGRNAVQLTSFGGAMVGTPRWSPDGEHVVFDARSERNADVYAVALAGGLPRRLTTEPADDAAPSWSRDGRWIYFASTRSGAWQVWKKPADGGNAVQVTRGGGFAAFESTDGATLYFTRRDTMGLWQMPTEGGPERPAFDRLGAADWGNWAVANAGIYFLDRQAPGGPALAFFDFAAGTVTPLHTPRAPYLSNPGLTVSPDGTALLYVQIDRAESDLMLVDLN